MDNEHEFVISDEAIAEQGKTAEVGDDFRSKYVSDLGLSDDEENKELIDKLVERETKLRAGYGELLGKKYLPLKKAYQELSTKNKDTVSSPDDIRKQQEQIVADRFNEEFLDDSDFSDEIKKEIRDWTKYKGVTAKKATKAKHIALMIEVAQKEKQNAEAANNGTGEGRSGKSDTSGGIPDKFLNPAYMMTEEGQKEYAEWEKSKK